MRFFKWSSIDNLSTAERVSRDYWKAKDIAHWVVTEKIDGTNISLSVTRDEVRVGKRTSFLEEGEAFYDVFANVAQVERVVEAMRRVLKDFDSVEQLTIYGEYFGNRILNRIDYGNGYHFRFFGMFYLPKGDEETPHWLPFHDFELFLSEHNLEDLLVPVLGYYTTFDEACKHPNDEVTKVEGGERNSPMEGVVISPYLRPAVSNEGNFLFKSKNPSFEEKHSKGKKPPKVFTVEEKTLMEAKEIFRTYCVKSRMYSVVSKEGRPTMKDAGRYIGLFVKDAREDFLKEHPEYASLGDKELKVATNVGSLGFDVFTQVFTELNEESA